MRSIIPIVLLLILGVALASPGFGPEFDTPGHYDGDEDDAGLTGKTPSLWAAVETPAAGLIFAPSTPTRLEPATSVAKLPQVLRD